MKWTKLLLGLAKLEANNFSGIFSSPRLNCWKDYFKNSDCSNYFCSFAAALFWLHTYIFIWQWQQKKKHDCCKTLYDILHQYFKGFGELRQNSLSPFYGLSISVAQSAKWPLHVLIVHLTDWLYQRRSKTHSWDLLRHGVHPWFLWPYSKWVNYYIRLPSD